MDKLESSMKTNYSGQAVSSWPDGAGAYSLLWWPGPCGVAIISVIQHHIAGADPGLVGLVIH